MIGSINPIVAGVHVSQGVFLLSWDTLETPNHYAWRLR